MGEGTEDSFFSAAVRNAEVTGSAKTGTRNQQDIFGQGLIDKGHVIGNGGFGKKCKNVPCGIVRSNPIFDRPSQKDIPQTLVDVCGNSRALEMRQNSLHEGGGVNKTQDTSGEGQGVLQADPFPTSRMYGNKSDAFSRKPQVFGMGSDQDGIGMTLKNIAGFSNRPKRRCPVRIVRKRDRWRDHIPVLFPPVIFPTDPNLPGDKRRPWDCWVN